MRAALLLLLAFAWCTAAAADPVAIRVAWTASPAEILPVLFEKKDLFRHWGQSYTVETFNFGQRVLAVRALAADRVDLESVTPVEFAVAVQNAELDDLRIIADGYQDGVAKHYSTEFMVRADSDIASVDELVGKVVAVDARGSMDEIALTAMLRRHELEEGRDYKKVELPPALMGPMLEAKKVDLASLPAPFSYALKDRDDPRTLFTLKDVLGPSEGLVLVARSGFIAENRAALQDFFADYLGALRWFLDPDHRDEAILIASDFYHVPSSLFFDYFLGPEDYFRDPDARPNLPALQRTMDLLRQAGILSRVIEVAHYADLSLVEAASRRTK